MIKLKRLAITSLAFTIALTPIQTVKAEPGTELALTEKTRYVSSNGLYVRSSSISDSTTLGIASKGTALVGVKEGAWFKTTFDGKTAYVAYQFTSSDQPVVSSETRYVSSSSLIVRKSASSTSTRIGTVYRGQKLVGTKEGAWFKTTFNGKTAYIAYKFTSSTQPVSTVTRYVKASKLTVRSKASSSSTRLGYLSKGKAIKGTRQGTWFKTTYNGKTAYVAYSYTSSTKPKTSIPSTSYSSSGSAVAKKALSYVGYRYTYSGASPSTGFDCSGFVHYVFKTVTGKVLPRTTTAQWRYGRQVSKSSMRAGDVIYFGSSSSSIYHVAIYVGNGKYVHAANPRRGVVTDSTSGNFFRYSSYGVRRIVD